MKSETVGAGRTLLIDKGDPEYETTGTWQTSTKILGHDGSPTEFSDSEGASVTWGTGGRVKGRAKVCFFKVLCNDYKETKVELFVNAGGQIKRQIVDLSTGKSEWMDIGTFTFAGEKSEGVRIDSLADFMAGAIVRVDAVKFEALENDILPPAGDQGEIKASTESLQPAKSRGPHLSGKSFNATVSYDPLCERSINLAGQSVGQLERERYFRIFYPPGAESDNMTQMYKELRISGARACLAISSGYKKPIVEDPKRPGFVDPAWVEGGMDKFYKWYGKAAKEWPGSIHAMALGDSVPWLMTNRYPKDNSPATYEAMADLVWQWYNNLRLKGLPYPQYISSQNEPPFQFAGAQLGQYTATMARRLAGDFPDVKVCGPCTAWPYPFREGGDWRRWHEQEKSFIDEAGGVVGGYDFHFYSKGCWAGNTERTELPPSLMEAQWYGINSVWDYGRVDAYLDLVAAHHMSKWGPKVKPVIITEFGHQSISPQQGPWENEFKPWLYMTTVTRLWMRFFERPEIALTVPFILGNAGNKPRGMAIINDKGVTRFRDFYAFFRDLDGMRIPLAVSNAETSDSRYLSACAFRSGDNVYILLHNGIGYNLGCQAKVKLACSAGGVKPKGAGIKRLKWTGAIPSPHSQPNPDGKLIIDTEYQPFDFTQELKLDGEETCLLRFSFEKLPASDRQRVEEIFLSDRTTVNIEAGREESFTVKLPETSGKVNSAKLGLGLFRDNGFAVNPRITVNGKPVTEYDFTWTDGISMYNSLEEIALPVEYLKPGENIVGISFPSEGVTGKTLVSSLRLRISQEVKVDKK